MDRAEWGCGIDIRLTAEDGKRILVQCKSHDKPISPGAVRALIGTARARWTPSCLRVEVTCTLIRPGRVPLDGGSVPA